MADRTPNQADKDDATKTKTLASQATPRDLRGNDQAAPPTPRKQEPPKAPSCENPGDLWRRKRVSKVEEEKAMTKATKRLAESTLCKESPGTGGSTTSGTSSTAQTTRPGHDDSTLRSAYDVYHPSELP